MNDYRWRLKVNWDESEHPRDEDGKFVDKDKLPDVPLRIFHYGREVKYDPSQPRVPGGNPEGGRWTGEGMRPGLLATGQNELYRWSNLGEIVALSKGKRLTSLDMTSDADMYFFPPRAEGVGHGKAAEAYVRIILDRSKVADAGWEEIPYTPLERLWRNKHPTMSDSDIARRYLDAITGVEIHDPAGLDKQQIADIITYRVGRRVPMSDAENYSHDWRSPSTFRP